jgi:hypothetical protein
MIVWDLQPNMSMVHQAPWDRDEVHYKVILKYFTASCKAFKGILSAFYLTIRLSSSLAMIETPSFLFPSWFM